MLINLKGVFILAKLQTDAPSFNLSINISLIIYDSKVLPDAVVGIRLFFFSFLSFYYYFFLCWRVFIEPSLSFWQCVRASGLQTEGHSFAVMKQNSKWRLWQVITNIFELCCSGWQLQRKHHPLANPCLKWGMADIYLSQQGNLMKPQKKPK